MVKNRTVPKPVCCNQATNGKTKMNVSYHKYLSGSCTENCRFTFQCQLEAESLNMHNTVGLSIQFNTQDTAWPRVYTNIRTHIHTHRVWFTLQKKNIYIYRYTEYVGPKLTKRLTNITKISQLCVYLPFPLTIFHVFVKFE